MSKTKLTALVVVALALLGTLLSLLLPTPAASTTLAFHLYFGLAYMAVVLFVGGSVLMVMGFKGFTAKLRRAYLLVCIGLSLIGISMFELPVLLSMGLLDGLIKNNSGVIALPFVAALVVLLIGTMQLVRLFAVKSLLTRWWFIFTIIVISCVTVVFLPHVATAVPEGTFDASNVANALVTSILAINMLHLLLIRKVAGPAYTEAVAWLAVGFMANIVVSVGGLLARLGLGDDKTYIITACTLIPLVPAGFLLLRSAYAFNFITVNLTTTYTAAARNFFGKPTKAHAQTQVTSIDIVVYAAQLASNLQALDDLLEGLRMVTSHVAPGAQLSAADNATLKQLYLKIEEYLITKEPVRTFTREDLRQEIAGALRLTPTSDQTFWGQLDHPAAAPPAPVNAVSPPAIPAVS